ncbi:hypothetical protein [Halorubrum laminariae]|uniref:Uncharacterized protein n=1 Tax=Halorubrum laminariae TaxID=1433523 RepID=A0ABD6C329_9EURY|nr:hypothetical protein [Halorubrum laminariae]
MADDKGSKPLTKRLGLWLHRTLVRFRLLPRQPKEPNSQSQSETEHLIGDLDFDDQWQIFRTGFLTVSTLFVVDLLALAALWILVGPTTQELLIGTIGLMILNLVVSLWVLMRVRRSVVDSLFDI